MRAELVTGIFPDFNLVQEWPSCSCDLNPLNFFLLSVLEVKHYAKCPKSLDFLKCWLIRKCKRITLAELRPVTENFTERLRLCIKTKGGLFMKREFYLSNVKKNDYSIFFNMNTLKGCKLTTNRILQKFQLEQKL